MIAAPASDKTNISTIIYFGYSVLSEVSFDAFERFVFRVVERDCDFPAAGFFGSSTTSSAAGLLLKVGYLRKRSISSAMVVSSIKKPL